MKKFLMYSWAVAGIVMIAIMYSGYADYLIATDGLFLGLSWSLTMLSIRDIK